MNGLRLNSIFIAFAVKRLTGHQVNKDVSNGHEFQGSKSLIQILGKNRRRQVPCNYYWLPEDEEKDPEVINATVSWYNARENQKHRSPEYRLYYPVEAGQLIQGRAKAGDLAVVALSADDSITIMIAAAGSTWERKLLVLFDLPTETGNSFEIKKVHETAEYSLAAQMLLDALGLQEPPISDSRAQELIDQLYHHKKGKLPPTKEFSAFARQTFKGSDVRDDPDAVVTGWMDWETRLFRAFEARSVGKRIKEGFLNVDGTPDVDSFVTFARSVGNTRFSRAGLAFEHHIQAALDAFNIKYSTQARTEQNKRPDFLFPGIEFYHDPNFPTKLLRMMGAKTSLKERWRQVVTEANRISHKHLMTLEAPISGSQMQEMSASGIHLVIPRENHRLFDPEQQSELTTFHDFILELQGLQQHLSA